MNEINYQEAATAFARNYQVPSSVNTIELTTTPINGGLINNSWKVAGGNKSPFLLQQINTSVFQTPLDVQQNYVNIWKFAALSHPPLRLPAPLNNIHGQTLYRDSNGNYWRAFEFIEDSTSIPIAQNPGQANATAKTFAKFTAAFKNFDLSTLKVVILNFHNLSFRYKQFEESIQTNYSGRMETASAIVNELKRREQYKRFYDHLSGSPADFPLRVMHHDAKIANVLFNKGTGEVICAVDFDTVMPGYYFSDLGDLIRSLACSEDENCTDTSRIEIRASFYDAIVSGYLEIMKNQLTKAEIKFIHYAGILMIYMQALRFISDYLNGDIYYRIQYPSQNLDRAYNQLTLLKKLEVFLLEQHNFDTYNAFPEK